jgi:hypothetical protein
MPDFRLRPAIARISVVALSLAMPGSATDSVWPLSFVNEVAPVLTQAGIWQRGFRVSLMGFERGEDCEHIVKEGKLIAALMGRTA